MDPHQFQDISMVLGDHSQSPQILLDSNNITLNTVDKASRIEAVNTPGEEEICETTFAVPEHGPEQSVSSRRSSSSEPVEPESPLPQPSLACAQIVDTDGERIVEDVVERSRSNSTESDDSAQVDWEGLERTEEQEPRGEGSDDQVTLLLARLEQENNALAKDPKSRLRGRTRTQSRPPSMHQLKMLLEGAEGGSRHSQSLPSPPPMSELDFWRALVADYPQTVQRLPTLTSNKIRAGIPPPLRGVTWQSMAGARDPLLEEQFDKLCLESSPYENIINKDIGRSFPGVEMFKDPDGEGQKMLAMVLKCFSLYDDKIGYCQGLGLLVGPLLMQMKEKEAFCVLVRLMDDYDLRSCFLPDLSGLHRRTYQFQRLLRQLLPQIATHLESLEVPTGYLSQWFLSFFAVTCPLPMLFRVYDVIFAEGASETLMRVALAIMRKNEAKILASVEMEEVMQLLISRAVWDAYGCTTSSADDLVNDLVSFTGSVTRETLQALEKNFKDAEKDGSAAKLISLSDLTAAASKFLGRLRPTPSVTSKSTSLSPEPSTLSGLNSFQQRPSSKQSLASSVNSSETGPDADNITSPVSLTITEATTMSRQPSADCRDLHGQIEELLTALSEKTREHAALVAEFEREREARQEADRLVKFLVDRLEEESQKISVTKTRRRTAPEADDLASLDRVPTTAHLADELRRLAKDAGARHQASQRSRPISTNEPKYEILDKLEQERELTKQLSTQLAEQVAETTKVRQELKEARARIQADLKERQRLEKMNQQLRNMNSRKSSMICAEVTTPPDSSPLLPLDTSEWPSSSSSSVPARASNNGVRPLKLSFTPSIRHQPTPSFGQRTSSLSSQTVLATDDHAPPSEEAMLVELVNAKTREAAAHQELEEMRRTLRKMGGRTPSPGPEPLLTPDAAKTPGSGGGGGFWPWGKRSVSASVVAEGK